MGKRGQLTFGLGIPFLTLLTSFLKNGTLGTVVLFGGSGGQRGPTPPPGESLEEVMMEPTPVKGSFVLVCPTDAWEMGPACGVSEYHVGNVKPGGGGAAGGREQAALPQRVGLAEEGAGGFSVCVCVCNSWQEHFRLFTLIGCRRSVAPLELNVRLLILLRVSNEI